MTEAPLLVNFETSTLDGIKETLASLFSEIKKLNPEKEPEQKFKAELVKNLRTCDQLSGALAVLFEIIDSKCRRIQSELSKVKIGDVIHNDSDVLSTYWKTLLLKFILVK